VDAVVGEGGGVGLCYAVGRHGFVCVCGDFAVLGWACGGGGVVVVLKVVVIWFCGL